MPAIGDLLEDDAPEILYASPKFGAGAGEVIWRLRAVSAEGEILWKQVVEVLQPFAQFSLYDFDADGKMEIALSEEFQISLRDGETGEIQASFPLRSPTGQDFPVPVDLEGDGSTELVVIGGPGDPLPDIDTASWEILIFGNPSWGATRPVWNQATYIPDHVTDSGQIVYPKDPPWLTHNTFRAQLRDLNHPPTAEAGPDFRAECASPEGTSVVLDGSRSFDPDEDQELRYLWTGPFPESGGTVEGEEVTVTLPLGEHEITLTVEDPCVADSDTVAVTVEDTTPPVIAPVGADPACLWPPRHGYHCEETGALFEISDACDKTPTIEALDIVSDQAERGPGSGPFAPDIVLGEDGASFCLRGERDGRDRTGRSYLITLEATDTAGNPGTGEAKVLVPHDKRAAAEACPDGTQEAGIGPEDRFETVVIGLPTSLPDHRNRRR